MVTKSYYKPYKQKNVEQIKQLVKLAVITSRNNQKTEFLSFLLSFEEHL